MRRFVGVLTLGILIGAAGTAWAAVTATPKTQDVSASFDLSPTGYTAKTCTGRDGTYNNSELSASGPLTSSTPALNGTLAVDVTVLVNQSTGDGTVRGTVTLTSGAKTYHGTLIGVADNHSGTASGEQLKGLMTGSVKGGRLLGTFSAILNTRTGHVTGDLGGDTAAVTEDLAVIQGGSCA